MVRTTPITISIADAETYKALARRIIELELELARLRTQVERGDALADAGDDLHERITHVLGVIESKKKRVLPHSDIVEARRVLGQAHLEHMRVLDAYRATATEDAG